MMPSTQRGSGWESFIIHLDILTRCEVTERARLRIFHYSPWYTYRIYEVLRPRVENLSLFTLIYLPSPANAPTSGWESFIIHLDILTILAAGYVTQLRIFHYSPWYTYPRKRTRAYTVENLSLFTLIYLPLSMQLFQRMLRIFHYSPWYTYWECVSRAVEVENLSLFTLIYLGVTNVARVKRWESFIIHLDILKPGGQPSKN